MWYLWVAAAAASTKYAMKTNYIIEIFESFLLLCVPGQRSIRSHRIKSVNLKKILPNERTRNWVNDWANEALACVLVSAGRRTRKVCGKFLEPAIHSNPKRRLSRTVVSHTVFTFLLLILHIQFFFFSFLLSSFFLMCSRCVRLSGFCVFFSVWFRSFFFFLFLSLSLSHHRTNIQTIHGLASGERDKKIQIKVQIKNQIKRQQQKKIKEM